MSAKHMRPFYVFAVVAAICAVVLTSGLRTSRADHGEQLIAGESPSHAGQQAVQSQAPIDRDPSEQAFPGTDAHDSADPRTTVPHQPGAVVGGPGPSDDDPLTSSGARDVHLQLPAGLELPPLDEGIDLDDLPSVAHEVRGAGEVRRGHPDEDDDETDDDEKDDDQDETGGTGSDGEGGPMSEDEPPADPGAGDQSTTGPTDPFVPEQLP